VATTTPSPHGRKGRVSNKKKASKKKTVSKTSSGAKKPSTKSRNSSKSYAKGFTTLSDDKESVEVVHTPLKKKSPQKEKGIPITTKTKHRSNAITPPAVGKEKSSSSSSKELPKKAHRKTSPSPARLLQKRSQRRLIRMQELEKLPPKQVLKNLRKRRQEMLKR